MLNSCDGTERSASWHEFQGELMRFTLGTDNDHKAEKVDQRFSVRRERALKPSWLAVGLEKHGYVFASRLHPEATSDEIASWMGTPWRHSTKVHSLVPSAKTSDAPNTYSGRYGLDAFPFHTDLAHYRDPPRYLMLRCTRGFASVATLVLDSTDLFAENPASSFARALVRPRRPRSGEHSLLQLYESHRDPRGLFRWDSTYLLSASRAGQQGMSAVNAWLKVAPSKIFALADLGDTLIIDNWRMLHARSAVPTGCEHRFIERAYLEEINEAVG
jgi:alpha-ketoglutarate-dependent taurine dioxygenase